MARKKLVQYFDDLDDTPLNEEQLEVVHFGLDGKNYVIDLSKTNATELRGLFQKYIEAGREDLATEVKKRRRTTSSSAAANRAFNRAARAWAREQGHPVADRGKLPDEVLNSFREAHPNFPN